MRWAWSVLGLVVFAQPALGESVKRIVAPNGLRVLLKPTPGTEVVAIELLVGVSACDEPPEKAGIRSVIQRLLLRGTELESGEEMARRLSEVGAFLDSTVGLDYAEVYALAPADGFEVALKALAAAVRHPAFFTEEVDRQKQEALEAIRASTKDPFQETYHAFRQALYGSHAYGRPTAGNEDSVASFTREDLVSFHTKHYVPGNAVLAICGGVTQARAMRSVRQAFGDWQLDSHGPQREHLGGALFQPLPGSQVVVRELPVERSYLVIGFPAPAADQPNYYPLQVLDSLLSGGATARLPTALRDTAGMAYHVSSFYPTLAGSSHLAVYAATDTGDLSATKAAILDVLNGLCEQPLPAREVERAKRYLSGTYLMSHQRMKDQAYALAWYEVLGLGSDFEQRYLASVQAVSPSEVQEAARTVLHRFVLAIGLPNQ